MKIYVVGVIEYHVDSQEIAAFDTKKKALEAKRAVNKAIEAREKQRFYGGYITELEINAVEPSDLGYWVSGVIK